MTTEVSTMRLLPGTKERLREAARRRSVKEHRDVTWCDLARLAIDEWLKREEGR